MIEYRHQKEQTLFTGETEVPIMKNKVSLPERSAIRSVAMSQRDSLRVDDGGYTEILL